MIYFITYQCIKIDPNALLALLIYLNQVCLAARFCLHCKMIMNKNKPRLSVATFHKKIIIYFVFIFLILYVKKCLFVKVIINHYLNGVWLKGTSWFQ